MTDKDREAEALFRFGVLAELLNRQLRRGQLRTGLLRLAGEHYTDHAGKVRRMTAKTLEEWYYRYKQRGFDGLLPRPRADRGKTKAISPEVQALILNMKREDPGRSVPLIMHELTMAGVFSPGQVSASTIRRLLKREGLSGPRMELKTPVRLRWQASLCGELWQADALHGPPLFDAGSGREVRVKIFGLLDDKSRLIPYARADFHETQSDFLKVLLGAIQRRGIPRALLVDNHGSFSGSDVRLACAKLGIRLIFARPRDGASKGKIERWWRTLRGQFLGRLDLEKVTTLDDLNLRLITWAESRYNRKPHAGLSGRAPLSVWEEDADQIRWVDDLTTLEAAFTAKHERSVRKDSTCQFRGKTYEVPQHLRGRKVQIHYSLLHPQGLWVMDADTCLPLREVDPQENARRKRRHSVPPESKSSIKTGHNAVEQFLEKLLRPDDIHRKENDDA
ncbi:DDE-type integrase/transposase/recombinase [Acidimicrobium ferrooxidans]|nr:DDE-type integrase/transposase/recombinase [Acidimicrobium ferrooxidans]